MRKIPRGLPYKRDRAQLVAPNLLGYPVLDGTFSIRFRVSREKYDWIKRVILELVSLSGEINSSHSHRILVPPMLRHFYMGVPHRAYNMRPVG